MGFSITWLAVKGKVPSIVRDTLDLRSTGINTELPETGFRGAELPDEWYLVIEDHADDRIMREHVLIRISLDCEVVTCFIEEHVMCSSAAGWRNGQRAWSVIHSAEKGIDHLEIDGEIPQEFGQIRDRLVRKREAAKGGEVGADYIVDYVFDAPAELAKVVTGFRHDEHIPGAGDKPFEILLPQSARVEKPSFWRRLFRP